MEFVDLTTLDPKLLLIPSIMVITAALRMFGVNSKYLTLCALVVGIVGGLALFDFSYSGALFGLLFGASASGLYDLKHLTGK